MAQSNVSPHAFTHFMEIFDGAELHFAPETSDDLMLLAQEFGHNRLITRLVPHRDFSRREGNVHELLQELDGSPEAQQSKLNSSPFAIVLPMCNAAYP
jgi:hypothetical protein